MRRAALTLGGTVAGLVALFSFRSHTPGITPVAEPSTPAGLSMSAPASASPDGSLPASPSARASATRSRARGATPAASPSATRKPATPAQGPTSAPPSTPAQAPYTPAPVHSAAPTTAAPSGTFTGPAEQTQYGPVQAQVTVAGGRITQAADVIAPADSIGANAVSQISGEVLSAQSANVQAVSGATYTSQGYIASLQAAVNQAGL
jgi:uncharacterized protein with FMN-binding domain